MRSGGSGRSLRKAGVGREAGALFAGVAALVLLAVGSDRAVSIDRLLANDASGDLRFRALPTIVRLIGAYAPWGSGLGTFEQVFKLHEPDVLLSPGYLNHAHNDWLELVATGGLAAVVLLVLSIGGLAFAIVRRLADRQRGERLPPLVRLGALALLLFALASLSDYPLRTPSLACLAAVAVLWTSSSPSRSRQAETAEQDVRPAE